MSGLCHVTHLLCVPVGLFRPLVSSLSFFLSHCGCLCREPLSSPSGVRQLARLSLTTCSTSLPSEVDVKTRAPSAHGESSLKLYNAHIAMIKVFNVLSPETHHLKDHYLSHTLPSFCRQANTATHLNDFTFAFPKGFQT